MVIKLLRNAAKESFDISNLLECPT